MYCKRCGAKLRQEGPNYFDKFNLWFCARRYGCPRHEPGRTTKHNLKSSVQG